MALPRRQFLSTAAGLWTVPALLGLAEPGRAVAATEPAVPAEPVPATPVPPVTPGYPAQDAALAREMVTVAHGNAARVRELLEVSPALAKAAWDWGFGDWETALGAASHMGNREIAALLLENGARPDLFTFAMLGQLDVVKACVAARPGIQKTLGPHGLTLLHHARKGGEEAAPLVAWPESLGDADQGYVNAPLTDAEKAGYVGDFAFGPGPADRFTVGLAKDGGLVLKRAPDGTNRGLFHQGGGQFHPPGNPAMRIRFTPAGEKATALTVTEGARVLAATRVAG